MEAQKFGARLKKLRNQAGMTQRELADRVNIDFTYLSKIESGAMPPPSENVISQLAEALNADKDELIILAGKVPSDIAQILKNQETLQHLRSTRLQRMARALKKRGAVEAQKFGARLRELRNQAGMTQRELTDRVNIDFTYLSKIESGAMPPPSGNVISQLAEALNADKDELIILAGKIPSDIAQILKNQETLKRLRSAHIQQMARASEKRGETAYKVGRKMKQLISFKGLPKVSFKSLSKVAIPIVLVIAVAASLWFASPVKALTIDISPPGGGTLGRPHSFTVQVSIEDTEFLPIQNVNLYIYKTAAPATYKATCANLPLNSTVTPYTTITATGTSGTCGTVSIGATAESTWGYGYGYGYATWQDYAYYFFSPSGYGYGYGYSSGTGTTSITYVGTWTSPSAWPAGGYTIQVKLTANSTVFTSTSAEFMLYGPSVPAPALPAPPVLPPGTTDVSDVVTDEGVFTETTTATSEDEKVELTIDEDTIGLTEDEEPLSEITIVEMEVPPDPPEDSNVIGLTYDFGPDEATFDPPITLTFTYDPSLIPEGVLEENLVIAMWDEDAGEWVELSPCTVDPVTNTITAPVSHFTYFSVLAYTSPATFTASALSITPPEVGIGETVTISTLVTNTGDLTGTYEVTLKIDNVAVATGEVTLAGGASQKVTFTTHKYIAGTYAVTVDGLSGTFEVKAAPAPAAFVASALSIAPTEVGIGETVTISTLVTNTGDLAGTYEVTLKIDNVAVATSQSEGNLHHI